MQFSRGVWKLRALFGLAILTGCAGCSPPATPAPPPSQYLIQFCAAVAQWHALKPVLRSAPAAPATLSGVIEARKTFASAFDVAARVDHNSGPAGALHSLDTEFQRLSDLVKSHNSGAQSTASSEIDAAIATLPACPSPSPSGFETFVAVP